MGPAEDAVLLRAHQGLLVRSPFFAATVSQFSGTATTQQIQMPNEELDSVGSYLQYLYTGEYYPRKIGQTLEAGEKDDEQLLKHARVYTLADKLGLMELKALAHSKVHLISASARGEIAYARYVYANTPKEDTTIRKPVASFWGQRSHVLRHEAEADFKQLCIEFPEFAFDVLTQVLDSRERKRGVDDDVPKSTRKRQRNA